MTSHTVHRILTPYAIVFAMGLATSVGGAMAAEKDEVAGTGDQVQAQEDLAVAPQVAQTGIQVPRRQDRVRRGETVRSRERPELDALGARAGSFIIYPSFDINEEYNDNIYADEDDEESDFITTFIPALSINSDWNNHSLVLRGRGEIGRYLDNDAEDFEDYGVEALGRLDIRRDTALRARVGYEQSHDERSSPDDPTDASEPTVFDDLFASAELFQRFNRMNFRLGGSIDNFNFDDVQATDGTNINNDDRDRDEYEGYLRAGYEIVPQYEAFVRGAYFVRDYDAELDDRGVDRDSDGVEVIGGVELDFGGVTFGNVFAGYRSQDYDDPTLDSVDGPVVGADVTWNVTPLTTIMGSISREIRETTARDPVTNETASGRFFTTVELSADHELLRNLLLGASVSYSNDDFEGIDRSDDIYRAGLNARYLINRYFQVIGGYRLRIRNSDNAASEFTENVAYVRLRVQY